MDTVVAVKQWLMDGRNKSRRLSWDVSRRVQSIHVIIFYFIFLTMKILSMYLHHQST